MPTEGLQAFLRTVVGGQARSPRHYAQELSLLRSRNGGASVLPTLTVIAGKLGEDRCVYQLRVETWTLDGERASGSTRESTGGRSTLKQAPCDTLVQEVLAVAEYELGSLQRRVLHGAPRATNQARDAIVAAARQGAAMPAADAPSFQARTLSSRVNLRAAPSLNAPVRSTLAPSTTVELVHTTQADWFALRDGRGFIHARALQARPATVAGAQPVLRARLRDAYVPVREAPSLRARVLQRLKPKSEVRVVAEARDGWHRLADQPGYIPSTALADGSAGVAVAGAPSGWSRLQP